MKKALRIISICILFISTLTFFGCSKSDCATSDNNYYIRYEVAAKSIHYETVTIEIQGEDDTIIYSRKISASPNNYNYINCQNIFSEQIGPVPYGFSSNINVAINDTYNASVEMEVKIYASKNSEPFVLKASNKGYLNCDASYTIDF